MKLNLGSNNLKYNGFLNVDIRKIDGVDILDNILKLETIEDESVESIIAFNILEHVSYDKTLECVKLWVRKLKKNGDISIGVPDGELIFDRYKKGIITRSQYKNIPWMDVVHSIFGNMNLMRKWHGEDADKYGHHNLFNQDYLTYIMQESGLINITKVRSNHRDNLTLVGIKNILTLKTRIPPLL